MQRASRIMCQINIYRLHTILGLHFRQWTFWISKLLWWRSGSFAVKKLFFCWKTFCSFQDSRSDMSLVSIFLDISGYARAADLLPVDTRPSLLLAFSIQPIGYHRLCVLGFVHSSRDLSQVIKHHFRSPHYEYLAGLSRLAQTQNKYRARLQAAWKIELR